jgi:hypothetical protein
VGALLTFQHYWDTIRGISFTCNELSLCQQMLHSLQCLSYVKCSFVNERVRKLYLLQPLLVSEKPTMRRWIYPDRNKTYEEMISDSSLDEIATYAAGAGPWKVRFPWGGCSSLGECVGRSGRCGLLRELWFARRGHKKPSIVTQLCSVPCSAAWNRCPPAQFMQLHVGHAGKPERRRPYQVRIHGPSGEAAFTGHAGSCGRAEWAPWKGASSPASSSLRTAF